MSIEHVALVMNHTQAQGAARAVMIGIASHANQDGEAYPGMLKLAQYGGYDGWDAFPLDDSKEERAKANAARDRARKSARRAIARLVELAEVDVDLNAGGSDRRPEHTRPNLYRVTVTCPPNCDGSAQHRLLTPEQTRARLRALLGVDDPVDNSPKEGGAYRPGGGLQARGGEAPRPPESSTNQQPNQSEMESNSVSAREHENGEEEMDEFGHMTLEERARKRWAAARERSNTASTQAGQAKADAKRRQPRTLNAMLTPPMKTVLPEEMQLLNRLAGTFQCPDGFGAGKGRFHFVPEGTGEGCARCGASTEEIIEKQGGTK